MGQIVYSPTVARHILPSLSMGRGPNCRKPEELGRRKGREGLVIDMRMILGLPHINVELFRRLIGSQGQS